MQKAIKYSKMIAWIGIILNFAILFIILILFKTYFDASWIPSALNILSPIAVIAQIMMIGGIVIKAIFEYKSKGREVKPTKGDIVFVLGVVAIVILYNIGKLF